MTAIAFLFALASVLCFVAHGFGKGWGLGWGLACAAVVALLIPAIQGLPGL